MAKAEKINEEYLMTFGKEKGHKGELGKQKLMTDISAHNINSPEKYEKLVRPLIQENSDLFAQNDMDLGQTDSVTMKIDTGDAAPIKAKSYFTPLKIRPIFEKAVDEMLKANIIERMRSPWSSRVVLVSKKDGTEQFCVDYRPLNKVTKRNSWPLPRIDEILAQLGNGKYFTTLALKSGYWQVMVDPKDKEKTAFQTPVGLFNFRKMPFGLCNAPRFFQELMSIVLQDCQSFALAYLDD